jgi:signal transduction histidine kinase/ligand-binding sensor domain-containing protein/DNA-binding NarL/FixJ family response regulator
MNIFFKFVKRGSMKYYLLIIILQIFCVISSDGRSFSHFTIEDGLSENMCQDIIVDDRGFLWKAGFYFLDRYNGYDFISYKVGDTKKNFLGQQIYGLYKDDSSNLYVLTNIGILRYSYEEDKFTPFLFDNNQNTVTHDQNGNLWAVSNNSLIKINTETGFISIEIKRIEGQVKRIVCIGQELWIGKKDNILIYNIQTKEKLFFSSQEGIKSYWSISFDSKGNLWFLDNKNLYFMDSYTKKTRQVPLHLSLTDLFCETAQILFKEDDQIWITSHDGCCVYDRKNQKAEFLSHNPDDPTSISSNFIISSFIDKNDIVWLATHQNGISYFDYHKKPFTHISRIPFASNSLISNVVYSIYCYNNDLLWIATEEGLDSYDPEKGSFSHFFNEEKSRIDYVTGDSKGKLYLACRNANYISVFEPQTGSINKLNLPQVGTPRFIYVNEFGEIYVGMVSSASPLLIYNPHKKQFDRIEINTDQKNIHHIYHMIESSNGYLWMGVNDGCIKYNKKTQQSTFIPLKVEGLKEPLKGCFIHYLFEDSFKTIWLASAYGLFHLKSFEDTVFEHITQKEGLPSDVVKNIQEDYNHNLWMGTDKGLCRYNHHTGEMKLYTYVDGVRGRNFEHFAISQNSQGIMTFGGSSGFTRFDPRKIYDNPYTPDITFCNLKISNQEINVGEEYNGRVVLKKTLNYVPFVRILHNERNFSISYAALHFSNPTQNTYAYKLEGRDDDWIKTKAHEIDFSNLAFGNYNLIIKASNNDGLWNENQIKLKIQVLPPWWRSITAIIIYCLFSLAFITMLIWIYLRQKKLKYTLKIKQIEKEKDKELNQIKFSYFTNISHEFKTPLTLIIGPLEQAINELKGNDDIKKKLNLVQDNARRLLKLINQLMDFRKVEQDLFSLNISNEDIVPTLKNVMRSFTSLAKCQNISLKFISSFKHCKIPIDIDQFENVLFNLFSNAVKYNKPDGEIIVTLKRDSERNQILLSIMDTGIGMQSEMASKIFDRFYINNTNKPLFSFQKSSGIGLFLTKKIINMHSGEIEVSSIPNKGTVVKICMPINESLELKEEQEQMVEIFEVSDTNMSAIISEADSENSPTILIVDDNIEIREYIRSVLTQKFKVIEAVDGNIALKKTIQENPDLIITDIMMPNIDGLDFCKALRGNLDTSHIPIIVLTSKTDTETKLRILEYGIDDFIEKPFDARILIARIDNVFKKWTEIRKEFPDLDSGKTDNYVLSSIDSKLVEQINTITEEFMSNNSFGVDFLSEKLGISRLQLYKKMQALCGMSPKDFIKHKKLSKARDLILKGELSISEIAYEVGFSAPSNFTKAFKAYFGKSPKSYKDRKYKLNK